MDTAVEDAVADELDEISLNDASSETNDEQGHSSLENDTATSYANVNQGRNTPNVHKKPIIEDREEEEYIHEPKIKPDQPEKQPNRSENPENQPNSPSEVPNESSPSPEKPEQSSDHENAPVPPKKIETEPERTSDPAQIEVEAVDVDSQQTAKLSAKRTVLVSDSETLDETFQRLRDGVMNDTLSSKEIINSVFHSLVGGPPDLESKFIIQNYESIIKMVQLLDDCDNKVQAEMWSVFAAIARKSNRNLEACSQAGLIELMLDRLPSADQVVAGKRGRGLIELMLDRLPSADQVVADLLIDLLGVLCSYSITVKEMKRMLKCLQAQDNRWLLHSYKLLSVFRQMPRREGPDVFFSFSGNAGSGIALPPISKWPYQNGWTFSTWIRMDPLNSVNFEKERPFVYCFRTNKGLGYSLHFMGNCLVVTATKGRSNRGFTRCIKQEIGPRKWHHVAISHVYSRWGKSEVHCFINGQLAETLDMAWFCSTSDVVDKCYIGCGPDFDAESTFSGQMGAIHVFSEALTLAQVNSMFCLGPGYQSQFQYDSETDLPEGYKRFLFDGKLSSTLMICYCPKNCDRQLCLESSPKENQSPFLQVPHAAMKQDVSVVTTHSVHSTLHSVGGVHMFLPLFSQLDLPHELTDGKTSVNYAIGSELLSVISLLLETSSSAQQQLFQNKGFLVISHMLYKASIGHRTEALLETFLNLAKFLLGCPNGIPLLKQLFDFILFNPGFWIHTPAKIQLRLYSYLASEFLSNHQFVASLRRTSTVLQMLHAVKYYYYVTDPRDRSGYTPKGHAGPRPSKNDVVQIRGHLLVFIRKLIQKSPDTSPKDEELQALFNYITTVHEDDNLYDVLQCTMALLSEEPATMVPAFDRKKGICVLFKLLASPNELIRLPGIKLLGYFLCRATLKRKQDVMGPQNLFTLLTDRLLLNASHLTMSTYNVLYEILTESMQAQVIYAKHSDPDGNVHFENPMILKVVAKLLMESNECEELTQVKTTFIADIIALCMNNRDNRRIILQMSVWQEWLISLAYVFPENEMQSHISSMVYRLFSMLLHHAIRLEYGGWRVWVDTLAIVHSKVSWEQFRKEMAGKYSAYADKRKSITPATAHTIHYEVKELVDEMVNCVDTGAGMGKVQGKKQQQQQQQNGTSADGDSPRPIYRTPEFRWSHVHVRLLSDLLQAIESDLNVWKSDTTRNLVDFVNDGDNQVFVTNTVHIISQLSDNLIMACGGLLPLLAAATSPNSELEIGDTTQQALHIETAAAFLIRFVGLADAMVFTSSISFGELESEKNMPSGGILRQTLRLVSTIAVRNILASKLERVGDETNNENKKEAIRKLVNGPLNVFATVREITEAIEAASPMQNIHHLVQEMDLHRLVADGEETRQGQFLSLACVYFLSVLMDDGI